MRAQFIAPLALACALTARPAVGAEETDPPLSLAPSSQWVLDYDDDSCRLQRTFGEGDDKVAFFVERYEPGDEMAMTIAGKPLAGPQRDDWSVRFGPDEKEAQVTPVYGELKEFKPAIIVSHVEFGPPDWQKAGIGDREMRAALRDQLDETPTDVFRQDISPEREAAVQWLSVDRKGAPRLILELGSMGKPMAAMRACTDELLTHWGIDLERHRHLSRGVRPANNPGRWLTSSDYPTKLLRRGMQGLIQFRVAVDERGRPTACHIQQSTRPAEFDEAVCNGLMRRAEFEPALDADGHPVASYWRSTVRFELPG